MIHGVISLLWEAIFVYEKKNEITMVKRFTIWGLLLVTNLLVFPAFIEPSSRNYKLSSIPTFTTVYVQRVYISEFLDLGTSRKGVERSEFLDIRREGANKFPSPSIFLLISCKDTGCRADIPQPRLVLSFSNRTSALWVPELPFQTWNYGKTYCKYQVFGLDAYLLEFWTPEAPVSGHERWVSTANWKAGEGLIFEMLLTQTELNDFGASSQAKLTPSARFSSVQRSLGLNNTRLESTNWIKLYCPPIYRLRAENSWRKIFPLAWLM
ncbi:hypothetical protein C1646_769579 [Rhizophagus diaphanus]|nr:hypothetical protein C1646_769579 [Rhizophagus diaphanus] [Rhizophagus sp. MUCL 43196]